MTTLIIAEKPSSSLKIAQALAEGKMETKNNFGVAYYHIKRGGKDIIVAPAVGHLFILAEKKTSSSRWTYPAFETEWKPVSQNKGSQWSKKYYQNLEKISKKADDFISACDYDIEGSVIAFNILRFICNAKDGKRMKFSTLTKQDLITAYQKASSHLDFEQIEAGLARHHLDFLWGINASRALTLSLKEGGGGFKVLSTGRVQGPTLEILEKREEEIRSFVSTPYWELLLTGGIRGKDVLALHTTGKFWKKDEAQRIFKTCAGKKGIVDKVERKEYQQQPPFPFDLTTLQRESYLHFGYSPKQTLDIAQTLYEMGAISYPRTASQKLPEQIGIPKILESLQKIKDYKEFANILLSIKPLKPHEGPKTDPAHPSIYPTSETPKMGTLNPYQKKLYDLIVRRFLAVFGKAALRETMKIIIIIEKEGFKAEGARTLQPEWMEFYRPYIKFKEQPLPPVAEGESVENKKLDLLSKETQPPSRYSQASILKKLEDLGLGTKATRAQILQTLYDRGYIQEKSIEVTELGSSVVKALEKYCADIISVDLTRKFEEEMESIQEGKRKKEDIIDEAKKSLDRILAIFKKHEKDIGAELLVGLREAMRTESTIGLCTCGGTLLKRRSKAGKPFVGCSNYPSCTQTFSLPHQGFIKVLPKKCECGLFIVSVIRKGRRPWQLCVKDGFKSTFKQKTPNKEHAEKMDTGGKKGVSA